MELAGDDERKSSLFGTAHSLAVQKFQEAKRKVSLKRVLAIDDGDDTEDPEEGDINIDDLVEDVEAGEGGGDGKGNSAAEESPADQAETKAADTAPEKGTADCTASEQKPVNASFTLVCMLNRENAFIESC